MNIRKAALALAAASSVALAGTSVAGAQTQEPSVNGSSNTTKPAGSSEKGDKEAKGSAKDGQDASGSSKLITRIGDVLGADGKLNGGDIFGSSKKEDLKGWGVALWAGLAAGVAGTVASVVIGIGNFLKHQGIIR